MAVRTRRAVTRPLSGIAVRRAVPEPADHDLLARCRRGDREAWELIVARYERLVYSVALRNGLAPDDAADITQTTFLALIDNLGRLRADDRLGSWLMTVARRQAWRIRHRTRREHPLGLGADPADTTDPIADWERVAWLYEGLQRMPSPCRELLIALYLEPDPPSYAGVARRFGCPIGSIGPTRGRCLALLRSILREREVR